MPVGAFGGRRDVMDALAPTGPVYRAGTLPVTDRDGGRLCLSDRSRPTGYS